MALVVGTTFAILVPLDGSLCAPVAHLVLALGAFGVVATTGRDREEPRTWKASLVRRSFWAWAGLALACLVVLRFRFPDVAPDPLTTIALPTGDIRLRSILDVALVFGIARLAFLLASLPARSSTALRILGAIGAIGLFGTMQFVLQFETVKAPIAIFVTGASASERAFRIFDLANILWCAGVLPFALAFDRAPRVTGALVRPHKGSTRGYIVPSLFLLLALLPVVVALMWGVARVDTLPFTWWLRKTITFAIAVGLPEESLWRLAAIGILVAQLDNRVSKPRRDYAAIAASTLMFSMFHMSGGPAAQLLAASFGLCAAILVVRYGLFWAVVAIHTLADVLLAAWN